MVIGVAQLAYAVIETDPHRASGRAQYTAVVWARREDLHNGSHKLRS
jgi:hypothetical protein